MFGTSLAIPHIRYVIVVPCVLGQVHCQGTRACCHGQPAVIVVQMTRLCCPLQLSQLKTTIRCTTIKARQETSDAVRTNRGGVCWDHIALASNSYSMPAPTVRPQPHRSLWGALGPTTGHELMPLAGQILLTYKYDMSATASDGAQSPGAISQTRGDAVSANHTTLDHVLPRRHNCFVCCAPSSCAFFESTRASQPPPTCYHGHQR